MDINKSKILTEENKKLYENLKPIYSFLFTDMLDFEFRSMLNASGMYRIVNIKNNVFYLGVASNLMTRFSNHKNHAKINSHDNDLIQDDINIYGIENFRFEILKIVKSLEEYNIILLEESKILFYCRKNNIHIYNIAIQPFKENINNNYISKLARKNETARRFSREWVIIHPNGKEEIILNLRNFCKINNLDHKPLIEIADDLRKNSYKGFKCKRGINNIKRNLSRPHLRGKCARTSKKYLITFPDGEEREIIGLSEFCREYKLGISIMCAIANGNADQYEHHGFKIKKL